MKKLLLILGLLIATPVFATVLFVPQGGTGASTLTGCLTGHGTGAITGSGSPCGAGGGSGGGTFATTTSQVTGQYINYPLNNTDIVTVGDTATTSAPIYFDPNLSLAKIFNQFFGLSSTTLQAFTFTKATGTNATTSSFAITNFATAGNKAVIARADGDLATISLPIAVANGGTGRSTLTQNQLLYGIGTDNMQSVATTSATCSGSVTCTTFTVIGGSPITLTGTDNTASSTLFADLNYFTNLNTFANILLTGSSTLQKFTFTNATGSQATTTGFAATTICFTGDTCRTTWPTGGTGVTSIATNNGITGGTITTTGTLSLDQTFGAIWTAASSTFVNGVTIGTATTTSATTTNFNTTNASTSQLVVSNSPSALLLTGSTGLVGKYGGASACGANNFVTALSAVGGTTCGTGTISGISIGSNLASLSHDSTLSGTSYNGSSAVSDWGLNLTTGNIWTTASTTFVGGVTFGKSTTTNATSTTESIGFASTTNFRIDTAKSALLVTNSTGDVSGYAGASACGANNFVTALSAVGGSTCGTSTISGVSLGGTLAALTAGTTLTSAGTYTGTTGRTFDIDLTHANTWTGNQMFVASTTIGGGTTSTGLTVNGQATTTNLYVSASSTLQNFTFVNATGSQATTTGFAATTICLSLDCRTAWPSSTGGGNSKFATTSIANSNGIYPNGGSLIDVILGATASTSKAKFEVHQSLAANGSLLVDGSSTLQNFTFLNATGTVATTTNFYATNFGAFGTTTPYASALSLGAPAGTAPLLAIGSTTSNGGSGLVASIAYQPYAAIAAGTSTPDAEFAFQSSTTAATLFTNLLDIASSTSGTNATSTFRISQAGTIFAPNTTLQSAAATDYWCYDAFGQFIRVSNTCTVSALKFKKDIHPLTLGLGTLLQMQPVTYYLKEPLSSDASGEQIGFIADWSASSVPDLITHDAQGEIHGFNYEQYTAVITKGIQDFYGEFQRLIARVSGLEKKVDDQQKQIDSLNARLTALENIRK